MKHVLEAFATRQPPRSAAQLLDRLTLHWADKPGGRTRQIRGFLRLAQCCRIAMQTRSASRFK